MTRLRRILISCGVVILVFLVFYGLLFNPKVKQIRELTKKHEEVANLLKSSKDYIDKYRDVKAAFEQLEAKWTVLQECLPDEEEMPALLRAISDAGKRSDVSFLLFKPLPRVEKEFYQENPIQIKVSAGYHEVGLFLSRVAQLTRLVNVSNFKFASSRDAESVLEAEFIATAYVTKK